MVWETLLLFKLIKKKSPNYLPNNTPTVRSTYRTRNIYSIPQFNVRHNFSRYSYFPAIVTEWNNLDNSIRNCESFSIFKKNCNSYDHLQTASFIVIILRE